MRGSVLFCLLLAAATNSRGQAIDTLTFFGEVTVTIDRPLFVVDGPTEIILYALPNGNTTAQTMGKRKAPGDDWHVDIQHIRAQTAFIREARPRHNIIVCYLENSYKSWPLWKQKHLSYRVQIRHIVDTLYDMMPGPRKTLCLSGHSGGGAFVLGYLAAVDRIPAHVTRISFLDSNYGYDSSYAPKLVAWLLGVRKAHLVVFAYNDSVALYNGKPLVSATGGTWYRSRLMRNDIGAAIPLAQSRVDSLDVFRSSDGRVSFYLRDNPGRGIYHTEQVERNGFIHAHLAGTRREEQYYRYDGPRAYERFIQ
ncbi:MAG: hypothetical protein JWP27_2585 [Flaviaesturariibacter sp.]|nr:hypothetical protein [Flaviaesturariibacter sp.]